MNPLNQHERIKQNDTLNPPNALGVWIQVAQLGRPVNCMDALFLFNPSPYSKCNEDILCLVSCAHPDGHATILLLSYSTVNTQETWELVVQHHWKAHTYRCTATYIVPVDGNDQSTSHMCSSNVSNYPYIATTSIKGECRLWSLRKSNQEGERV